MKKLLLVDGNSMLFRAYYATVYGNMMKTSKGEYTNAVYGFAMMLNKAFDLVQPDACLVAFDAGKKTFRHTVYPEYKAGRKDTPQELIPQFKLVRDLLDAMDIKRLEIENIEADDIIGTMSKKYPDWSINILSSDQDLLQLIDPTTSVWLMKKGLSEIIKFDEEQLKLTKNVTPQQIVDLKGLMGDTADNIPGVKGVGEKTAIKLLAEYQTVENIYAHIEEIKGKLQEKLINDQEMAFLSKQLATIKTDVELNLDVDQCDMKINKVTLKKFYQDYEMNSLAKNIEVDHDETQQLPIEVIAEIPSDFSGKIVYFDTDNYDYQAKLSGIALSDLKKIYYVPYSEQLDLSFLINKEIITYDFKRSLHLLAIDDYNCIYDTLIAMNLCESNLTSFDKIANFMNFSHQSIEEIYGKGKNKQQVELSDKLNFIQGQLKAIQEMYDYSENKLKEYQMEKLFYEVEMPLTRILYRMEKEGICIDQDYLEKLNDETKMIIDDLKKEIFTLSKEEFNLNSPKQLAYILFDVLNLPSGKKRSTSVDVLEKLKDSHPIVSLIMQYRKYQKLYSTYTEGLKKYILPDGKIHTIYNQTTTSTGRLSSSEPNLQNISVRDEFARKVRKAFVASKNHHLIASDYSQVELRVLAHLSNDQNLISAFYSNIDIHTKTAMEIFNLEQEEITANLRRKAKAVNFGIVYGISGFGLANQLDIDFQDAKHYIETYLEKYSAVKHYMEHTVDFCKKHGYVTTILHRKRDIPEINAKNNMLKKFGERAAMNAPIQGSAADLIKLAMINIDQMMHLQNVQSKMILQVHDELIFDVVDSELDLMKEIIKSGMENALQLHVPLVSSLDIGLTWYETK